jgi:uncharacterized membrane protein
MLASLVPFELSETSSLFAIPVIMMLVFGILMIASFVGSPGANLEHVGRAILCYLMKSFGLALMVLSFGPVLLNVLTGGVITMQALIAPILVFTIGAWCMVQFNITAQTIEPSARAIPHAIFLFTFEFIGIIVSIVSGLSLITSILYVDNFHDWAYQLPVVGLLIGLLIALSFGIHTEKLPGKRVLGFRRRK